jgi:hypothetical protein
MSGALNLVAYATPFHSYALVGAPGPVVSGGRLIHPPDTSMDVLAAWGGIRLYRDLPFPGLIDEPVTRVVLEDAGCRGVGNGSCPPEFRSGFFLGRGLAIAARLSERAGQLKVEALACHADRDPPDAGPGVEPEAERPESTVVRRPGKPGEAERRHE